MTPFARTHGAAAGSAGDHTKPVERVGSRHKIAYVVEGVATRGLLVDGEFFALACACYSVVGGRAFVNGAEDEVVRRRPFDAEQELAFDPVASVGQKQLCVTQHSEHGSPGLTAASR